MYFITIIFWPDMNFIQTQYPLHNCHPGNENLHYTSQDIFARCFADTLWPTSTSIVWKITDHVYAPNGFRYIRINKIV